MARMLQGSIGLYFMARMLQGSIGLYFIFRMLQQSIGPHSIGLLFTHPLAAFFTFNGPVFSGSIHIHFAVHSNMFKDLFSHGNIVLVLSQIACFGFVCLFVCLGIFCLGLLLNLSAS
jgi:hypothetical protein